MLVAAAAIGSRRGHAAIGRMKRVVPSVASHSATPPTSGVGFRCQRSARGDDTTLPTREP